MEKQAPEKPGLSMLLRGFSPGQYFFPLEPARGKTAFIELELRMQTISEVIDRVYLIVPPEALYADMEKAVDIISRYERKAGLLLPSRRMGLFDKFEDLIEDGLSELMINFNTSEALVTEIQLPPEGVRLSGRLNFEAASSARLRQWVESLEKNPPPIEELWITLSEGEGLSSRDDFSTMAGALTAVYELGAKLGFASSYFVASGLAPCVSPRRIWPSLVFPLETDTNRFVRISSCETCAANELCPGLPQKMATALSFEPAALAQDDLAAFQKPAEKQLENEPFEIEDLAKRRQNEKRLSIVYMEVTQKCPLNCASCFLKDRGEILTDPPLEQLYRAIDNITPYAGSIWIVGFGEPLSRRELPEIIARIRSAGLKAGITSSGMFLSERRAEQIADSPPDHLALSLSSFDAGLFAQLRDGRLDEMLKSLANAKKYWGAKTQFFASYLLQRENLHRMARDVEEAARLGFDVFITQPFVSFNAEIERRSSPYGDMTQLRETLAAANETAARCGIEMYPVAIEPQGLGPCAFELETRCIVRADMSVGPCCPQFSGQPSPMCFGGTEGVMQGLSFGQVDRTPLPEIFDSEEYVKFRTAALGAEPPQMCRVCGFTHGVYTPS